MSDRGPIIPPDKIAEIFEPFYSGKSDGMAIALASQGTIDAHGGRTWYTQNPTGGAIFSFTLRQAAE